MGHIPERGRWLTSQSKAKKGARGRQHHVTEKA
jgi:hypothetical protein